MAARLETEQGELYCPTCEQTFARGERCPTDDTRLVRIAGSRDSLIGRELDGRYTIVEPIGHGAMGAVYRGTQHSVGREVAIKVVMPNLVANPVVIMLAGAIGAFVVMKSRGDAPPAAESGAKAGG